MLSTLSGIIKTSTIATAVLMGAQVDSKKTGIQSMTGDAAGFSSTNQDNIAPWAAMSENWQHSVLDQSSAESTCTDKPPKKEREPEPAQDKWTSKKRVTTKAKKIATTTGPKLRTDTYKEEVAKISRLSTKQVIKKALKEVFPGYTYCPEGSDLSQMMPHHKWLVFSSKQACSSDEGVQVYAQNHADPAAFNSAFIGSLGPDGTLFLEFDTVGGIKVRKGDVFPGTGIKLVPLESDQQKKDIKLKVKELKKIYKTAGIPVAGRSDDEIIQFVNESQEMIRSASHLDLQTKIKLVKKINKIGEAMTKEASVRTKHWNKVLRAELESNGKSGVIGGAMHVTGKDLAILTKKLGRFEWVITISEATLKNEVMVEQARVRFEKKGKT